MKKQVMTIALAIAATAIVGTIGASAAKADGFVCQTTDHVLKVKVYNQVDPSKGTRNPAIMVLSDARVEAGRKTIAKFAAGQTLEASAATYDANVDLRFSNSNRSGEYLLGTRLGELDTITVAVDFSYGSPVEDGSELTGLLTAVKRNGQVIEADLECVRYLKN